MRFAFACLIASLSLVVVYADNIMDREGYYFVQRPRLGHLKNKPFIDLYKNYAAAFVKPKHPSRPNDDFRNYMPAAEECMNFFSDFRWNEYEVRDLDDFVVLDACLGYLYESKFHEEDSEVSQLVNDNLFNLKNDEKLMALYNGTKIDELEEPAKECIGDLLLNIIQAKNQYKSQLCNSDYIQVFVQFADCQSTIPFELVQGDTYLEIVYGLVEKRANACFDNEINAINRAVRSSYANNPFRRVSNTFASRLNPLRAQAKKRMYPQPIVDLLSAVQNTTQELNLREVHNILRGISMKDEVFVKKLLNNMGERATKTLEPKKNSKMYNSDPKGSKTYQRYVDNLCSFFRRSDNKKYYDYATPIIRMNRLLSYPNVFGITSLDFINKLLLRSHESGALYLSVSACNVLTFTEGGYNSQAQNGPLEFVVKFKRDTSQMIRWPDAGFY